MKVKYALLMNLLIVSATLFSKTIVNGYYITLNGDTVHSRFVLKDLFDLHRQIVCIDSLDNQKPLSPQEIRSFTFRITRFIERSRAVDELDHAYDQLLATKGYVHRNKAFSLDAEINATPLIGDSIEQYQSMDMGDGTRLFLSIDKDGDHLQSAVYYTKLHPDKPYLVTSIWVLVKDHQLIPRGDQQLNDWVASAVGDYTTLSVWVKAKKINSFPWDFNWVVADYNNWVNQHKPDTTDYLKGLIDAHKQYNVIAPFTMSYVAGTVFFLPGMITAVIVSHNPKEHNIKIPEKSEYRNNPDYRSGFQHRAYDKKYRAAGKGALLGGLTCVCLLVLLL